MIKWICFLLLFGFVYGEILETNDFGLIEREADRLDSNSLIVFDVDDTLITPKDAILHCRRGDVLKGLIPECPGRNLFREILVKAPHSIVDERSRSLMQRLQEKNIPALAFTAARPRVKRGDPPCDWRIRELKYHGFDFGSSFPDCEYLELLKESNAVQIPMYKQGVLFSAFHPKGLVLVRFLEAIGFFPTKVIFVDDDLKNVKSVVEELEKVGIACLGVHYTAARDFAAPFDPEWAEFQINHFLRHDEWLSDEQIDFKR